MQKNPVTAVFRYILIYGLIAIAMALAAHAEQRNQKLAIEFDQRTVKISGVSVGKQVIAFSAGITRIGHTPALTREAKALTDDDRDGAVELTVHRFARRSVWIAVDVESGDYVVATPTGVAPKLLPLPDDFWQGNRTHLNVGRTYLEVVVVRPKVGAWTHRIADGDSRDADGRSDGISTLHLEAMEQLAGEEEKRPPFAVPKDVLVVVDPQSRSLCE